MDNTGAGAGLSHVARVADRMCDSVALRPLPFTTGKFVGGVVPGAELARHLAAIDQQGSAGDVRRGVRGQERNRRPYLFGLAAPAQGNMLEVRAHDRGIVEIALRQASAD